MLNARMTPCEVQRRGPMRPPKGEPLRTQAMGRLKAAPTSQAGLKARSYDVRNQPISTASTVAVSASPARSGNDDLERRAAERRIAHAHAPVVRDDELLHDGQAQAGAARPRGEERLEDLGAGRLGHAWPVVVHADAAGARRRPARRSRSAARRPRPGRPRRHCESGCRTPGAAAPRRLRSRRTCPRTSTVVSAAARASSSSAARRTTASRSTGANTTCSGRANFRKFVTTWPSASVSCRMPSTYGR